MHCEIVTRPDVCVDSARSQACPRSAQHQPLALSCGCPAAAFRLFLFRTKLLACARELCDIRRRVDTGQWRVETSLRWLTVAVVRGQRLCAPVLSAHCSLLSAHCSVSVLCQFYILLPLLAICHSRLKESWTRPRCVCRWVPRAGPFRRPATAGRPRAWRDVVLRGRLPMGRPPRGPRQRGR